jgi:hypothetical protein
VARDADVPTLAYRIAPEPTPAEAAAIAQAVGEAVRADEAFAGPGARGGAWSRAAAEAAVEGPTRG